MIDWILKYYVSWHAKDVERSLRNPESAQLRTFHRLQKTVKNSELSRNSGFSECQSLETFRKLPTSDSKSLAPFFEKVYLAGNLSRHVFGQSRLLAFGRTSGTSGKHKDIPINKAYRDSLDRTLRRMVTSYLYATQDWSSFFKGRQIILASRPFVEFSPTGLPVGDISGLIPTRTWPILRWLYIPRFKDLWIKNWLERRNKTLELSHGKNVMTISGIPALMKDFVKEARARHNGLFLDEIWPNLKFYIFGAASISDSERENLCQEWFVKGTEHKFHFVETYFTTEACLAHSFNPLVKGLALNLQEILFSFKEKATDKTSLLAHELKCSKIYLLFITTPGGLINYAMGDKIKVISERPLLIQIVGRQTDEISITGAKISLEQLVLAVNVLNLSKTDFVVWQEESAGLPHLAWGFSQTHQKTFKESVRQALDKSLSDYNFHYNEALNIESVIGPSKIYFIPSDIFESYTQKNLGIGQFKAKRIFQTRDDFEKAFVWKQESS